MGAQLPHTRSLCQFLFPLFYLHFMLSQPVADPGLAKGKAYHGGGAYNGGLKLKASCPFSYKRRAKS